MGYCVSVGLAEFDVDIDFSGMREGFRRGSVYFGQGNGFSVALTKGDRNREADSNQRIAF